MGIKKPDQENVFLSGTMFCIHLPETYIVGELVRMVIKPLFTLLGTPFVTAKVTEIKYGNCFAVIALSFKMSLAVGVERVNIPTAVGTMQFSFRQFGTFGIRYLKIKNAFLKVGIFHFFEFRLNFRALS